METILLDDIVFTARPEDLRKWTKIFQTGEDEAMLSALLEEAVAIARPKAVFRECYIGDRGDDYVVLEGVRLTSRVMSVNLERARRVFPFVVTCGVEIEQWSWKIEDMVLRPLAETIKGLALAAAKSAFEDHLSKEYLPGKTSMMNPGSIADWPIEEQKALFRILGDVESLCGVRLLENCFMAPAMTVSGVRFPVETTFESCQLCPREACPGRRAPYDQGLFERRYRKTDP